MTQKNSRAVTIATAVAILIATPPSVANAQAPAHRYKNCAAMHRVYAHGVGKPGAHDKTKSKPVTTFHRSKAIYLANKGLDRDHDGIACEAH